MEDSGNAATKERPLIDVAQQDNRLKERGVRFELTDERGPSGSCGRATSSSR